MIITTGNKNAIEAAIECAAIPAECFQVGVPVVGEKVCIDGHALMHKRILRGSIGGDIFADQDIPTYLSLNEKGQINVEKLITHVFPFEKINDGIEMMRSTNPGRVLIEF